MKKNPQCHFVKVSLANLCAVLEERRLGIIMVCCLCYLLEDGEEYIEPIKNFERRIDWSLH